MIHILGHSNWLSVILFSCVVEAVTLVLGLVFVDSVGEKYLLMQEQLGI